jgi:hypothetical protein
MSISEMPFEEDLMVHDYDNPLLGLDSSDSAFSNAMDEVFTDTAGEAAVV